MSIDPTVIAETGAGPLGEVGGEVMALSRPPALPGQVGGAGAGDPGGPGTSPLARSLRQVLHDRAAMVALAFLVLVLVIAVVGLWWTPYPPNRQAVGPPLVGPSARHWLGTDDLGRDVASRLIAGARLSLRIGVEVVFFALVFAVPFGLYSGYKGRLTDNVMMRVLDALTSVPGLVLAVAVAGVLGPGVRNVIIALTIVLIPAFARLIRNQALAVSAEPYVTASRSSGTSTARILLTRILPGVAPALIVQVSLALGTVLVADASLSFLGLGVRPPGASWGAMLQRAYANIFTDRWGILPAAAAIGLTVLAFNVLGDGLRDALGVGVHKRMRRRARLGLTSVAPRSTPDSRPQPDGEAQPLLSVQDLRVAFDSGQDSRLEVLDGVSFDVRRGELLALVGESGSGKTVTAMAIMRLLTSPPAVITGGRVLFDGIDLLGLSMKEMRAVRGAGISMVFQNPMSSLDPSFKVSSLLGEALRAHHHLSRRAVRQRAVELLDLVGIPSPARRLDDFPHQFSGGMRQRVMIAMALASEPKLLLADEPTTALDVSVQAQILELLASLRARLGMAVLLVTHDLGVVADLCDRVAVMYAGQVVEQAPVEDLFRRPAHPYTAALMASVPSVTATGRRLQALPGIVPSFAAMPAGCRFHTRCPHAEAACEASDSDVVETEQGRQVRCRRARELSLPGVE